MEIVDPFQWAPINAGTALGDPIELNAALSVLNSGGTPVQLTAAKSCMGHSEPAAGGVGITHAALMLANCGAGTVMHLRHFNPMLGSILHTASCSPAVLHVPRQSASRCTIIGSTKLSSTGVSAFAFQGTNAHGILVYTGGAFAAQCLNSTSSNPKRYWFAAAPNLLVSRLAACQQNVMLETLLFKDALAHLWDHQVQQRPLFPAAAMLAAAHAAGVLVLDGAYRQRLEYGRGVMLESVSIPTPLVLPQAQGYGSATRVVLATVITPMGFLHQQTNSAATRQVNLHLSGELVQSHMSQSRPRCLVRSLVTLPWSHLQFTSEIVPVATANVVQSAHAQPEHYTIHPTVMDNVTQVSATAPC